MSKRYTLSVFTKPWKEKAPGELGQFVAELGFDAIEFPLRDGYQVAPENAEAGLPALSRTLREYGVKIASVASSTDESIFAACQAAEVPVIRIMLECKQGADYMAAESAWKRYLESLCPLCKRYGVKVAVQQHYGWGVFSSMELRHVLEGLDCRYIGGIWDAAHSALAGEHPEKALGILWDYLTMVNFKTAFYSRTNGPESGRHAEFSPCFTTATQGAADWKRAVKYLQSRDYGGVICMPAEYTDSSNVARYIARDIVYLKSLLEEGYLA